MEQKTVYIIDGIRTPIGSPFKSLKNFTAAQLGGVAIKKVVGRNKIRKELVDEVIIGNTVGAGTGQNLARQTAYFAGLSSDVSAYTVNNVCGAGLQSIVLAVQSIQSGNASIVIAGGAESATKAPFLYPNEKGSIMEVKVNKKKFKDSLSHDGLFCDLTGKRMGDLVEQMAKKHNITRQQQDQFSLESHLKACVAQQQAKFLKEIVPIAISTKRTLNKDERPRRNISLANLEILPAAFKHNGLVTAGNSSVPSDGACALIIASEETTNKENLVPQAKIVGYSTVFVDPKKTFVSGEKAIRKCLNKNNLTVNDIDLFEISEAFATQVIFIQKKIGIPFNKLNVWGGDIALGHPLGAAGTRIVLTLMNALIDQKKKRGIACISLGGGGSIALLLETL